MQDTPRAIGRYRIDAVLGRGGMGVVYAGWDSDLQRKVAIKVIGDASHGRGSRARLVREARAMAKLSHPNVLTVFEVGSDNGVEYIAMELVDGSNLTEWLGSGRTRREILRVFLEAGRGLAAAHAAGMIHRDFKPHNVLMRRDGRALVTDFGLARLELDGKSSSSPSLPPSDAALAALVDAVADTTDPGCAPTLAVSPSPASEQQTARSPTLVDGTNDALTRTGAILGTPGYMAPEQFHGRADARSDQFSFCVALWHALAGRPPFEGTSDELAAQLERGPAGELRGRIRAILARGLAVDPRARWPSMDALLHELSRPVRRARWAMLAAALAIAGGGLVIVAARGSAPPPPSPPSPPAQSSDDGAPARRLLAGSVRHLTMEDGCDEFPSFTPDGRTVVYDTLVGRDYQIVALEVATGAKRRLTDAAGWSFKPAVSPDGTRYAYLRREEHGEATYVAPLAGGAATRVGVGGLQPIWALDGRALWIGHGETAQLVALDGGAVQREIKAPPQQRPQEGIALPDGRLALLEFPQQGDQTATGIAIYARDGTWRWLLEAPLLESIALAPGGKALLVAHLTESGTRELWSVPLDGSPHEAVAGPAQPTSGIAVSRDGDRIAWSDCEPKAALATLTGNPLVLAALPTGAWTDQLPTALPDAHHVVVASDRDRALRLWVVDLEHRDAPRELPAGAGEPGAIAVSSDGKTVYSVLGDGALDAQPLDGSAPPVQLATAVTGALAPRSDGSIVVGIGGDTPSLAVVPAGGGEPTPLVRAAALPAVGRAGELYYVSFGERDRGTIQRRDVTGGTRPLAAKLPARPWRALAISPDGTQLALLEDSALTVVELATGRVVAGYDAGADMLTGVTWLGKSLLVSRVQFQGDLWLVGAH